LSRKVTLSELADTDCVTPFGRFLRLRKSTWGHRRGSSQVWTASIIEKWRPNSGSLHAIVAFQVRDRRYLNSLHATRSEQITSTPGARRGISPRTPAKSAPRIACPPLLSVGFGLRATHRVHQPQLRLRHPVVEQAPVEPRQPSISGISSKKVNFGSRRRERGKAR